MKLYYGKNACSLSPHIALREAGFSFELERVDTKTHKTQTGQDFYAINPKGQVPVLELGDRQLLTEGPAIVQYIADLKPESKLAPPFGTLERYRLQEWLNFFASEIHKSYGPLFKPGSSDDQKEEARGAICKRLDYTAKTLGEKPYLLGDGFTVADGYLFVLLRWTGAVGIALGRWESLERLEKRIAARPTVKEALAAEETK
jgi:glutathione S-transferase